MKNRGLSHEMCKLASELLRAIGGPQAEEILTSLHKGEWGEIARKTIDPTRFDDPMQFRSASQAYALLKKMPTLETGIDTVKVAEEAFLRCEAANATTNFRLQALWLQLEYPMATDGNDRVLGLIKRIRTRISKVLGEVNYQRVISLCEVTSGSTYNHKGSVGSLTPHKLSVLPESTNQTVPLFTRLNETIWWRIHHDILFNPGPCLPSDVPLVRGNRFSTVAKDATKDRGICVEPTLNLFAQKGIGNYLRGRLQHIGLLQTRESSKTWSSEERHQELARQGSVDGTLATVDLSDASDLISYWLVKLLLPEEWFSLLEMCRSPLTLFRGRWYHLEKFSSMGNGFTFELETLIFYAITRSIMEARGVEVTKNNLTVYGDDIICPSEVFDDVCAALRFFGMIPNPKKSFSDGPFRESCGGDFFLGKPVRPIYFKLDPKGPAEWIVIHNLVYRLRDYYNVDSCLNLIKGFLPTSVRRCAGPPSLGDICLHDERTEKYQLKRTDDRLKLKVVLPKTNAIQFNRFGWESALGALILSRGTVKQGFPLRGDSPGYRIKWVPYL